MIRSFERAVRREASCLFAFLGMGSTCVANWAFFEVVVEQFQILLLVSVPEAGAAEAAQNTTVFRLGFSVFGCSLLS